MQRLLVQVQGGSQDGGDSRLSAPLTHLALSYVCLWFSVGVVLTLSWLLGYSSKLETAHRYLTKIQCGENSQRELN